MTVLPKRPAARLLVLDEAGRLLLFRFIVPDRPPFWATVGGAVDPGESFEEAARRELLEETGFDREPGPCIAIRHVSFKNFAGVLVDAEERFFVVRGAPRKIDDTRQTEEERRYINGHRWWTPEELAAQDEIYFPVDLLDIWRDLLADEATS